MIVEIRRKGAPSLRELEAMTEMRKMTREDYRHAWAWVHFMLHGPPEAREELILYLAAIKANTPPGRLSDRLRQRLGDTDQRFKQHFERWSR
jgi:hypothetical protein